MNILKTVLIFFVISLSEGFTSNENILILTDPYEIGDVVDDFKLKNIDGSMISMSNFKDSKGFVIIFTCNTCPVSVANEDRIIALDHKYKTKGYPVIAINPNNPAVQSGDGFDEMVVRANEKGFTFPYLLDDGQKVFPKFGASKTPHVFLIQKEKKGLVLKYRGAIDDSSRNASSVQTKYLEIAIDSLLEGKSIENTSTRAIGCSIKV